MELGEEDSSKLLKLLREYKQLAKLSNVEVFSLRRQASAILLAGGEVKLVHVADSGYRLEMSLPKVKRVVKRKNSDGE